MKTFRMIGCILAAVCLCLCMASCSDDDDEGGSDSSKGKNKVTLGDKTFKVPYGFWYTGEDCEDLDNDEVSMEFYSFNPTSGKMPSSMSYVAIEYKLADGKKEINSTVIESGKYHVYVATGVTMSSEGLQCETEYNDIGNSDLKIIRDGNKYTVTIEHATVSDDNKNYDFSFNYTGNLKHQYLE